MAFLLSYNHGPAIYGLPAAGRIGMGGTDDGMSEAKFRHRHDGWTPARQVAFLRSLRETARACGRRARMSG